MSTQVKWSEVAEINEGASTLRTINLDEGQALGEIERGTAAPQVVLVLQGRIALNTTTIERGGWALWRGEAGGFAIERSCIALLEIAADIETLQVGESAAGGQWFPEYDAFVRPLAKLESLVKPWSAYWIEIPGGASEVATHVHENVKNIVAIAGLGDEIEGYLLAQDNGVVEGWPLVGGDLLVIEPSTTHNLIATGPGRSLKFFVFNDGESNYQEPQVSDYHHHSNWRREQVALKEREFGGNCAISLLKAN